MCSSTLIASTASTSSPTSTGRGQVEDPRLDLRAGREPGRHGRDGRGVGVGDDMTLEAADLGGELAQPRAHLEHELPRCGRSSSSW